MQLDYFQLVDRVVAFDAEKQTIAVEAVVPDNSTIFEGHFPGYPLMPGVLLIEAMAQTSGWLLLGLAQFRQMPFLVAVKDAKLRSFVTPGTALSVTASLLHAGSGFSMTEAKIRVAGKLTCSATLTLAQTAFPNDALHGHMMDVSERIGFPKQAAVHG